MPPEHARFIRDVGVPSVIALFLIWFLSGQLLPAVQDHTLETETWMRQLITISRQICVNTASSPDARSSCFDPVP